MATSNRERYIYDVGLDNVRAGVTSFESRGILVSNRLDVSYRSDIGLRSLESRPYLEDLSGDIKFTSTTYDIDQDSSLEDDTSLSVGERSKTYFLGSIEYWVIKRDFNKRGRLVKTTTFPILPLGTTRVYHERLILNTKSDSTLTNEDVGNLIFFATDTDSDIKVYRNGILTEKDVDWEDITTQADRTPNNGTPMLYYIKILDQLPGDIFTVSYSPVSSSTQSVPVTMEEFTVTGGLKIVDMVGDLTARLNPGKIVAIDRPVDTVRGSRLFLSIIMRRNTAESSLSPVVEEYSLMAGNVDSSKFEDL